LVAAFGFLTLLAVYPPTAPAAKDSDKDDKAVVVVMETSMGTIEIELNAEKAPITVKNFLGYVEDKYYDGTIFHRVIKNFMIQGGGITTGLKPKKTRDSIKNEAKNGLSNVRGTIAMARTDDPDSATSQFYINVVDNSEKLDPGKFSDAGYCVFGKVTKGINVADRINKVATGARYKDMPNEQVVIKSVRVKK
jgi:peptidyl-prolyl cis-trans isomerase B (cyclophilin B)